MAERLTAPTKYRVASTKCNSMPAHPTSNATLFKFFLGHKLLTFPLSLFCSVLFSSAVALGSDCCRCVQVFNANRRKCNLATSCTLPVASCTLHFARSCGTNKNSTQNFSTVALCGTLSTATAKPDK